MPTLSTSSSSSEDDVSKLSPIEEKDKIRILPGEEQNWQETEWPKVNATVKVTDEEDKEVFEGLVSYKRRKKKPGYKIVINYRDKEGDWREFKLSPFKKNWECIEPPPPPPSPPSTMMKGELLNNNDIHVKNIEEINVDNNIIIGKNNNKGNIRKKPIVSKKSNTKKRRVASKVEKNLQDTQKGK